MRLTLTPGEKPLSWIGLSHRDRLRFPARLRSALGFALSAAQYGGKHPPTKPWKGEGPGVLEVVKDFEGDTYRAIYTVRFPRPVYVLHAFQKKSPRGISTRKSEVDLIRVRLRTAHLDYEDRYGYSNA